MSVDVDAMNDEAYYYLLFTELKEAIAPLGWKLIVSEKRPWRFFVHTPGWHYEVEAVRWTNWRISPLNSSPSRGRLCGFLSDILTKNRA
jgi:hypothetical protein